MAVNLMSDDVEGNDSWVSLARDWRFLGLFLLGLFFLCLAIGVDLRYARPDVVSMNNGYSGAFRDAHNPDPLKRIEAEEVTVVDSPTHTFAMDVPTSEVATIEFYYTCEPACEKLWLIPRTIEESPSVSFLLRDPVMDSLHWFYVEDQQFRLYQRVPQYETISDLFLDSDTVSEPMMESTFLELSGYPDKPDITLDSTWDLPADVDAIVTTYQGMKKIGDFYFFGIGLPVSYLDTSDGKVSWKLRHVSRDGDVPEIKIARLRLF